MAEGDPPAHPLAHVTPEKCHELLMAERNLLVTAKADRENELVRTIIQVSSAGLLLIPTVVASKEIQIPRFDDAKIFYLGLISLAVSLVMAIIEQHLSSRAYARQIEIVFDYYTKKSDNDHDSKSVNAVRWTRTIALALLSIGIVLSAIGLATLV